eukprot:438050_1
MFNLLLALPLVVGSTSTPRFVSYIDKIEGWWPDSDILKALGVPGYTAQYAYNVLNLAFLQSSVQPADALDPWVDPTKFFSLVTMQNITGSATPTDDEFRTSLKQLYHGENVKVIVSCFGAGDYPTKTADPVTLGKQIGEFVIKYQFDGVDIDWEDSPAFESGDGTGEYWLANLTSSMRSTLGSKYIITHAPQAPYFMGTATYKAGGYLYVQDKVGSQIDWYNIQFYNQGSTTYNSYSNMFQSSVGWSSNSAVYQMINANNPEQISIPANKIVVGKHSLGDGSDFVDGNTLKNIFNQALATNSPVWNTGFMCWQFYTENNQ